MASVKSKWLVPLDAGCREFVAEFAAHTVRDGVQSGGAHFHVDGFLNKQNIRFLASENP
jgi:hypothetical protein